MIFELSRNLGALVIVRALIGNIASAGYHATFFDYPACKLNLTFKNAKNHIVLNFKQFQERKQELNPNWQERGCLYITKNDRQDMFMRQRISRRIRRKSQPTSAKRRSSKLWEQEYTITAVAISFWLSAIQLFTEILVKCILAST